MVVSGYNVELRDKNGDLKKYLTPFISGINWEWNRLGGCGRCSITLKKKYRDIIFAARDDIQIRVKDGSTSKLVYRGYIANIVPTLKIDQDIVLDIRGYFDLLAKLAVQDDGDTKTYTSSEISEIVEDIVDNYIIGQELDTNIKALIHFDGNDGANTYTAETGQTLTFAGNAQLDTADKKFGASSLLLDGTGDYVTLPASADWNFDGDFTIDCWIKLNALNCTFIKSVTNDTWSSASTGDWILSVDGNGYLSLSVKNVNGGASKTNAPIATGSWYHVAVVRSGSTTDVYINGVKGNQSLPSSATFGNTKALNIGLAQGEVTNSVNGWIEEVRISKGIARWTSNFTPPSKAHTLYKTKTSPNTPITKGTIDVGSFTADTIQFLTTVQEALDTLANLTGDIEYGVDENLVFFWRTESETVRHKFFAGDNVAVLERRVVWDDLVNKLYLVGGTVAGVRYKRTAENGDSQEMYYLSEEIVNNGSIISDTVADEYLGAKLREGASPTFKIRAQIKNTSKRIEDTVPLGLVLFYDSVYDRNSSSDLIGDIIGEAVDGGSDIVIGEAGDGGSDVIIGGQYSAQIDRISYELSNTPGRFNITIQLGDTILETAAKIKQLELAVSSFRQD